MGEFSDKYSVVWFMSVDAMSVWTLATVTWRMAVATKRPLDTAHHSNCFHPESQKRKVA